METQPKSYLLPISILLAAVIVAGAVIFNANAKLNGGMAKGDPNEPTAPAVSPKEAKKILSAASKDFIVLGDPKAKVEIVEFSDFQCPFCAKFHKEAGEQIRKDYIETGKAKMVLFDLVFLGPESVRAAEATHCAGDQKKYWTYHDKLLNFFDSHLAKGREDENGSAFSDANLNKFAKEIGLDTAAFSSCLSSGKYASKIERGQEIATQVLGAELSTPSIFVNGELIQGAQPYRVFKEVIEKALKNS